jgi:ABC-type transport system involved in cytochrome c biogenesis permease subunit
VLQAVLDTQFWLATHVVTINLGYAATYMAGIWGVKYLLLAHIFPVLSEDERHKLLRMLYGTLCFAIFFSFIGTVLGGLWADDSWGRFWGWDPKENGALMIVLWNALVLHARWGGLVKGRGLATLAVAGNIVTTWSYFGVNELGVGLHAYGASERNTGMWLFTFALSQLVLIALGMMPQRWFQSLRPSAAKASA